MQSDFSDRRSWAAKNKEHLDKMLEEGGLSLANHGYFHKVAKLDAKQNEAEITSIQHTLVKGLTGYNTNVICSPSGSFSDTTLKVAYAQGMSVIMWK